MSSREHPQSRLGRRAHAILLLAFGVVCLVVALAMSETSDEAKHVEYGKRILQGRPEREEPYMDSKEPISALNGLPPAAGKALEVWGAPDGLVRVLRDIRAARIPSVLAAILLCWIAATWARELYGVEASLAVLVLFCLSPNLIAHATLATNDLYGALGCLLVVRAHWGLARDPNVRNALLAAAAIAVAQWTKFSAVYLYFLAPVLLAPALWLRRGEPKIRGRLRKVLGTYAAATLAFALVAINLGSFFSGTFAALRDYRFESETFRSLADLPLLRSVPIPLPGPYVQGFDMMLYNEQHGTTFGNLYLLGEVRPTHLGEIHPFHSYYLVTYLLKEPLPLQLLALLGLVWIWRHRTARIFFQSEWFLVAPAAFTLMIFSYFNKAEIGIRHVLQVFPFTLMLAGIPFRTFSRDSTRRRAALALLVGWLAVSVGSYFPHMIPYMNELVFDRKASWKWLADSNLSWGQNRREVEAFLARNPDVALDPALPRTGRVLVDANRLVGVVGSPEDFRWLREGFEPIGHVAYGHVLYRVDEAALP